MNNTKNSDYVLRTVAGGCARVFVADTRQLVETARQIHNTSPVVSAAFGRLLTASTIIGVMQKNEQDIITIQIKGDGPLSGMLTTAYKRGYVKGYVINPDISLPLNALGKLDVSGCIGNGELMVMKDVGLKEPYTGRVPLVSGEIAADFAYYFTYSEQTPSAVALGVLVDRDFTIKQAGGFIVQMLPSAEEHVISTIEKNIAELPSVTTMLDSGLSARDILEKVTNGLYIDEPETIPVRYECDCTRERVEKALISLGKEELSRIIKEDHQAELTCHFCDKIYKFEEAHLVSLCI